MEQLLTQESNLANIISTARLESYRYDASDDFAVLFERYMHNIAISEALYPILSLLEVTLRNRIHQAVAVQLRDPEWLLTESSSPSILLPSEHGILAKAEQGVYGRYKKTSEGALVADLTLGFWVNLCKKAYKNNLWDKQGFFDTVFPNFAEYFHITKLDRTEAVFPELKSILRFRNRVFHHEIIINHSLGIENCYTLLKNVLFALSSEHIGTLDRICRFKEIVKQKP